MINPNTQAKYLNNPQNCPHCESDNMTADAMDNDTKTCWRTVRCLDCNKEWREVYQLASIEEVD
jgi:formate dehydrogenase maturation protein FdhE